MGAIFSTRIVRVLRVAPPPATYADEVIANVRFTAGDGAADLAGLVRRQFPRWNVDEGQVAFIRVTRECALAARRDPAAAAVVIGGEPLAPDEPIANGEWLLARVPPPTEGGSFLEGVRSIFRDELMRDSVSTTTSAA